MGYEIRFSGGSDSEEEEVFFLGSIGVWEKLKEWATLNRIDVPLLTKLIEDGSLKDTQALGKELMDAEALLEDLPEGEAFKVFESLVDLVGAGDPEELVEVIQ